MSRRYFPWRLFRKFLLGLVILLNLSFIATLAMGSFVLDFDFYREPTLTMWAIFAVFSTSGAALFTFRVVTPMRRVILKALRLANKKQVADWEDPDQDLFESEPGEYFELELALDKIRKKLKKRRAELAHEREESQALMSSMQDAVLSVSREGRLIFFNSRFATLFLDSEQMRKQSAGAPLLLMNVFRDPELLKKFETALQAGASERYQVRMPTVLEPQGRFFSVTMSPLREEKTRTIYGILILFHDISDLKQAEQIRIEFVENASHELRTPLTSIKGFLETAREDLAAGKPEHVPQFLETIAKSVDRLSVLVNDMLTISSLENRTGLRLELMSPEVITQDAFERLAPMASDKKIMLKVIDESEPFKADPVLVETVLINLVENAIKYIQEGGQIEVRWQIDPSSRKVLLRVKDNGPGIAEEHQARLFERFYRVDKGRSRDVGGTGLGLSIVKHIMQSHGGEVRVCSKIGQGCEFVCEFPFRL